MGIRKSKKSIRGVSNGGVMVTDQEGELSGFFTVYYNPSSLMNIISFKDTRKRFMIMVDTAVENSIIVRIGEGRQIKCLEIGVGLYIWRPKHNSNISNKQISSYSFLNLVEVNTSSFARRELDRADADKGCIST